MAHRHRAGKKKVKKATKSAKPVQQAAKAQAPEVAEGPLSKIERALEHGAERRAVELLDGVWPRVGGQLVLERVRWLLARWPARAAVELGEVAGDRRAALVEELLVPLVLRLPEAAWEAFAGVEHPLVAEAALVRSASAAIAAGRDEEGAALLRGIGLRSPFREARLFLRGLSAFYRGEDGEVLEVFGRLGGTPYGRAAEALRALIEPPEGEGPLLAFEAKGAEGLARGAMLRRLHTLLKRQRLNAALRTGAFLLRSGDAVARAAVTRLLTLAMSVADPEVDPEDLISRAWSALGADPEDPDGARLLAVLAEVHHQHEFAAEVWPRYEQQLRRGVLPRGVALKAARAAVLGRVAALYARSARSEDEREGGGLGSMLFFRYRHQPSPFWQDARLAAEQALALDDSDRALWDMLLWALDAQRDHAEHGRVLERMVERFPEEPAVWRQAAQAAVARRSFVKAQRHMERAIALEPMSRDLRDTQSAMLLGLAVKYFHEGKGERAQQTCASARKLPWLTPDGRLRALGFSFALEEVLGHEEEALALRDQALAEDGRAWLLAGHQTFAWEELVGAGQGRKKGVPLPRKPYANVMFTLEHALAVEELRALIELAFRYDGTFEPGPTLPGLMLAPDTAMHTLLRAAMQISGHLLTTLEELRLAQSLAPTVEARLRINEAGDALFPDMVTFMLGRYEAALELKLPHAYFEGVEERFQRAILELRAKVAQLPGGMWGEEGGGGLTSLLIQVVEQHLQNVRRYLAPKAASPAAGKGKGKGKAR